MKNFVLDAKYQLCPMPVIHTQNKVAELNPGDRLKIICTDPGAKNDIPAWCRVNGHRVLDIAVNEQELVLTIEVGEL